MEFKLNEVLTKSEMRQYIHLCYRLNELKRRIINGKQIVNHTIFSFNYFVLVNYVCKRSISELFNKNRSRNIKKWLKWFVYSLKLSKLLKSGTFHWRNLLFSVTCSKFVKPGNVTDIREQRYGKFLLCEYTLLWYTHCFLDTQQNAYILSLCSLNSS